ncbi:MAG: DEAD/DEAH box helicase family protein [Proteobacteria bacterium]|nr:DEAD/DEAH box helicase family protein [Pseudomonadota bacterium]
MSYTGVYYPKAFLTSLPKDIHVKHPCLASSESFNEFLKKVLETEGGLERINGRDLLSCRLNRKGRLLFTWHEQNLILIDIDTEHKYNSIYIREPQRIAALKNSSKEEYDYLEATSNTNLVQISPKEIELNYFNGEHLELTPYQKTILQPRNSAVIQGPAGSGKTAIAQGFMYLVAEDPDKKCIFICMNQLLAKQRKKDLEVIKANSDKPLAEIIIVTYQEFIDHYTEIQPLPLGNDKKFNDFFNKYHKTHQEDPHILALAQLGTMKLYQALQILSVYEKDKDYDSLGDEQCLIPKALRVAFWKVGQSYLASYYDMNCYGLVLKKDTNFNCAIVDEGQNFTVMQLLNIFKMVKGNFLCCLDPKQWIGKGNFITLNIFYDLLFKQFGYKSSDIKFELNEVYRYGAEVTGVANNIVKCLKALDTQKSQSYPLLISCADAKGGIQLTTKLSEEEIVKLKTAGKSAEFAIFSQSEFKEEAIKIFGTELVFTEEDLGEYAGVEFEAVLFYKYLKPGDYKKLNESWLTSIIQNEKALISLEEDERDSLSQLLRIIYTILTRSKSEVIVVQPEHHLLTPFLKRILNKTKNDCIHVDVEKSTETDWQRKRDDLSLSKIVQEEKVLPKKKRKRKKKEVNPVIDTMITELTPPTIQVLSTANNPIKSVISVSPKTVSKQSIEERISTKVIPSSNQGPNANTNRMVTIFSNSLYKYIFIMQVMKKEKDKDKQFTFFIISSLFLLSKEPLTDDLISQIKGKEHNIEIFAGLLLWKKDFLERYFGETIDSIVDDFLHESNFTAATGQIFWENLKFLIDYLPEIFISRRATLFKRLIKLASLDIKNISSIDIIGALINWLDVFRASYSANKILLDKAVINKTFLENLVKHIPRLIERRNEAKIKKQPMITYYYGEQYKIYMKLLHLIWQLNPELVETTFAQLKKDLRRNTVITILKQDNSYQTFEVAYALFNANKDWNIEEYSNDFNANNFLSDFNIGILPEEWHQVFVKDLGGYKWKFTSAEIFSQISSELFLNQKYTKALFDLRLLHDCLENFMEDFNQQLGTDVLYLIELFRSFSVPLLRLFYHQNKSSLKLSRDSFKQMTVSEQQAFFMVAGLPIGIKILTELFDPENGTLNAKDIKKGVFTSLYEASSLRGAAFYYFCFHSAYSLLASFIKEANILNELQAEHFLVGGAEANLPHFLDDKWGYKKHLISPVMSLLCKNEDGIDILLMISEKRPDLFKAIAQSNKLDGILFPMLSNCTFAPIFFLIRLTKGQLLLKKLVDNGYVLGKNIPDIKFIGMSYIFALYRMQSGYKEQNSENSELINTLLNCLTEKVEIALEQDRDSLRNKAKIALLSTFNVKQQTFFYQKPDTPATDTDKQNKAAGMNKKS